MNLTDKIVPLNVLAQILSQLKAEGGRKVIHCHGVFDLLHIGHIRHFEQAKLHGDVLVVTLTPDRYVNKGPHRPAFPQELRAEALAALDCVDYVAINQWPTAVETIKLLRPHYYAKGSEYSDPKNDLTGKIVDEAEAVKSVGGTVVFTEDITFSSSTLINRHFPIFSREMADYLSAFKAKYSSTDVRGYLDGTRSLRALVVGEAIIDEYQYCETMGKSGKEPILAARFVSQERSAGGALAASNHVAAFCENVGLLTVLGAEDSHEDFIVEQLRPNVERIFLYREGAPTIVKRRFVETYPFQKLFEIYIMSERDRTGAESRALCEKLESVLPQYDVVIVTDYGHGMIGPEAVQVLCEKSRFLAVNTQLNADNHGFNTISKYKRADFVSISERELRLDARSRTRDIHDVVEEAAARVGCPRMVLTQGRTGCLCYHREEGAFKVPAFTNRIVDRIGAGDALFAVTSLVVAQGAPMELVGFVANAVGAQAVGIVGNQNYVEREPLLKHVESLLK